MSELVTKSVAQGKQEQKIETRTAVERIAGLTIVVTAVALLAVIVATAVYAKDKYSLKSPSGISFSDFRGYEDWAVVSSARTDQVLKVIVGNPTMIKAYKAEGRGRISRTKSGCFARRQGSPPGIPPSGHGSFATID